MINTKVRNILRAGVQPKLKIGAVNDPAEMEADQVADQVMRMSETSAASFYSPQNKGSGDGNRQGISQPTIRRKCTSCEDDKILRKEARPSPPVIRRRTSGSDGGGAPASAEASSVINSLGSGSPLLASERSFFEPRFGRDLSDIRIHTGHTANDATRAINARAFNLGNNIAFANGEYNPGTHTGRTLMAHEIAHAFQSGGGVNDVINRKSVQTTSYEMLASLRTGNTQFTVTEDENLTVEDLGSSIEFPSRDPRMSDVVAVDPIQVTDYWFDSGTIDKEFRVGANESVVWNNLDPGTYYLDLTVRNAGVNPGETTMGDLRITVDDRPANPAPVVDTTSQAWSQYSNGNGEETDIGPNSINDLLASDSFLRRHRRIIGGLTSSLTGNFSVDMTTTVFHIGRTNVDYAIVCNGDSCTVTYTLFGGDGFWDVDYIDEYTGMEETDGAGPNLERFGGSPYAYRTAVRSFTFDNPGY